ncbi:uncharacterized protein LOC121419985 isoform X2 [Lytechinus variegatus]|uniref:uncharacterized protein LOC121419985 isoform X2 n=1 Tax=Lytechinus variegatus TaxID=7654 RepID=UPI001BB2609A|nr:uncharacterized protein LOC121419985 isoform X2 [Lytechinus variegatus]
MTETLTEEKLNQLAEAVANNENLLTLGLNLGFKESKVKIYISTNKRNDSFEGTSSMLFAWKKKTRRAKQIPDLIKALVDAELAELVDDFFPSEEGNPQPAEERNNFDDILVTVAKTVRQNADIVDLGTKLGFTREDIEGYIATSHTTHKNAWDGTLQMLRDWSNSQRGSSQKEALEALLNSGQIRPADILYPLSSH